MVRVVAVKVVRKSKLGCLQIETQIGRPQIETRTSANRKWYTRSSPDGHLERISRWTATSQEEGGSFPAASQEEGRGLLQALGETRGGRIFGRIFGVVRVSICGRPSFDLQTSNARSSPDGHLGSSWCTIFRFADVRVSICGRPM